MKIAKENGLLLRTETCTTSESNGISSDSIFSTILSYTQIHTTTPVPWCLVQLLQHSIVQSIYAGRAICTVHTHTNPSNHIKIHSIPKILTFSYFKCTTHISPQILRRQAAVQAATRDSVENRKVDEWRKKKNSSEKRMIIMYHMRNIQPIRILWLTQLQIYLVQCVQRYSQCYNVQTSVCARAVVANVFQTFIGGGNFVSYGINPIKV